MLFTRASEYLTGNIGHPTVTVGPPKRQSCWLLSRARGTAEYIEVKLEESGTKQFARLLIVDAYARGAQREEVVTILEESDFKVALERVQAHTGQA
jgi:hypothetical protein